MRHCCLPLFILFASLPVIAADAAQPSGDPRITEGGHRSPVSYKGMTLAWREEFAGNALDGRSWRLDSGTGNRELQHFQPGNARVRDGYLVITARRESHAGSRFTSARAVTRGKPATHPGRIDIRAKLPEGQGLRPAIRLPGTAAGEIDIMEMIGGQRRENTVHGTIYWREQGQGRYEGGSLSLPSGTFADQFHVFSLVRDETSVRWLVDGYTFFEWDTGSAAYDVLREPFDLLLELAVGGERAGEPAVETVFPQHLVVDYIRVFEPAP